MAEMYGLQMGGYYRTLRVLTPQKWLFCGVIQVHSPFHWRAQGFLGELYLLSEVFLQVPCRSRSAHRSSVSEMSVEFGEFG